MDEAGFKKVIYGQEKGILPSALRTFFRGIAALSRPVIDLRNTLYDKGWKKTVRFPIPVISVGNLTLGGTGKTPMTAQLLRRYLQAGCHPGLLSRGYKSSHYRDESPPPNRYRRLNDEAAELAVEFPEIPHFLSPNRIRAGQALLETFPKTDLIILDDGFQYRRLHRGLNILLLDGLDPFGGNRLFPAGFLREPLASLRRADLVLLTRADFLTQERRQEIRTIIAQKAPHAEWGETMQRPVSLVRYHKAGYEEIPFAEIGNLSPGPWLPFCGLGNPNGFYQMLKNNGILVSGGISFPDHTSPDSSGLDRLSRRAAETKSFGYLTTMKDLVKLRRSEIAGKPLWGVKITIDFLTPPPEQLWALPFKKGKA